MSKLKHTPGPWSVHEVDVFAGDACIAIMATMGTPNFKANAHLIAAAPDLLAALKWAQGPLTRLLIKEGYENPESLPIMVSIQSAIAKAKGE